MKTYNLTIYTHKDQTLHENITKILKVEHIPLAPWNENELELYECWNYELSEKYGDEPVDFIKIFLDILEPNLSELLKIGIEKSAILISIQHEYGEFDEDNDCIIENGNFKLSSENMKRLGENGLDLELSYNDVIHYSI
jgi:hypothetical protein